MGLAFGLIYWLVQSGKLDFSLLSELIKTPSVIIISLVLMHVLLILVTFRLRIFLHQKVTNPLSFFKIHLSNWIGLFFNSVLPGSVSGDLIKIFYIQKLDEKLTKKYLLISVFIDRLVGLIGLILLGGVVSAINYNNLINLSTDVSNLTHANIILSIIILFFLSILFVMPSLPLKFANFIKDVISINLLHKIIMKCEELWNDLILFKTKLIGQVLISMLIQATAILVFWYIAEPFSKGEFTLTTAFSVMPIGFICIAIPIAPAGLGVGHVVFEKLLGFFQITNGASLFNLYFFVLIISNLSGVIPYLLHSTKPQKIESK